MNSELLTLKLQFGFSSHRVTVSRTSTNVLWAGSGITAFGAAALAAVAAPELAAAAALFAATAAMFGIGAAVVGATGN